MAGMKSVPLLLSALCLCPLLLPAADFPLVSDVEPQPLRAQVRRVVEAMDYLGFPLGDEERSELENAFARGEDGAVGAIQELLDRHALLGVHINPEMRVKVSRGPAAAELQERG